MASVSPPKPWERAGAGATGMCPAAGAGSSLGVNPHTASTPTTTNFASTSQAPSLPPRPSTLSQPTSALNSVVNRTASNYSPYGSASRLGSSPYGGYGSMNSYSSPYSRFGGMGSSMYGGMGGMGGMYGGMGGMGGMYGGMGGMGMQPGIDPNDPNSLTNSFSQSTQATFQIIESIVGAFGGFAQMLESTYMATHSSFFAMVSVAEQFSSLRQTLGSILGIFTLLRYFRTLLAKLTGRPPPADATSLTPSAFFAFQGLPTPPTLNPDGSPASPARPSKKPFLVFLLAVFGLPYLMGKLIRALARTQEESLQRQQDPNQPPQQLLLGPDGRPLPPDQQPQPTPIDPSKLEFCRVLYDYVPDTSSSGGALTEGIDLAVARGDLVAVLSKADPVGQPSEWWRCRARNGKVGYLPGVYLEPIQRKITSGVASGESSRAGTMTTVMGSEGLNLKGEGMPAGKGADVSAEGFVKSQFYN